MDPCECALRAEPQITPAARAAWTDAARVVPIVAMYQGSMALHVADAPPDQPYLAIRFVYGPLAPDAATALEAALRRAGLHPAAQVEAWTTADYLSRYDDGYWIAALTVTWAIPGL